jgi:hypothetical protein
MSAIVTPQGIAAQQRWESSVITLMPVIYSHLAQGPTDAGALVPKIAGGEYDQSAVREAMWRLLDKRLVRLEMNRELTALHRMDWGEPGTFDHEWGPGCLDCNSEWPCTALRAIGVEA